MMEIFVLILTLLSLIIWIGLIGFRGGFWKSDQRLPKVLHPLETYPFVGVIIPARNEAELIPKTLTSLLVQNYLGQFKIILVDDQSSDETGKIALETAKSLNKSDALTVICSQPLPSGWTGKLWAMQQGVEWSQKLSQPPEYLLFTDADIEHSSNNLQQLVEKAEIEKLQLVSLMVLLRCQSFWEKLLIPAFVFFFQKLYPFRWVNQPNNQIAAAAGGCILIQSQALSRIGGLGIVKQALIDDCSLAQAVKLNQINPQLFSLARFLFPFSKKKYNPIWLGLTDTTHSLRPYPNLSSIWDMVARTAFSQLNFSLILLILTVVGMIIIYLMPILSLSLGIWQGNELIISVAIVTWLLMAIAYYPTLKLYRCSPLWGFSLPLIGLLYTFMTFDSAFRYWQGKGGSWKGRIYE